jgi:two-component system response regulator
MVGGPVQILLVDDDPHDVAVALRAVRLSEDLDVRVAVAGDGREALEALGVESNGTGATPVVPCVVLLDLEMPRIDGWEVLRRLRATPRTRDLPVVSLSWSAQREDIESCYALGANSFLVKRISLRNPGAYFAEAVRYWVDLNHPPLAGMRGRVGNTW